MLWHKIQGAGRRNEEIEYVGGYVEGLVGTDGDITVTFGGSLTGGLASSASAGDLVVAYVALGGLNIAPTALNIYNYVRRTRGGTAGGTYDTTLSVFYKFMGPTPDTTLTLEGGTFDVNVAGSVVVHVFRNVDPSAPIGVLSSASSGTTIICDPPSVTPTISNSIVVVGGAGSYAGSSTTYTSSGLTNFLSSSGLDAYDSVIGAGYYVWTSGAYDPAAFNFSASDSTSYSNRSVTLSLTPLQLQNQTVEAGGQVPATNNSATYSTGLVAPYPETNRHIIGIGMGDEGSQRSVSAMTKDSVSQTIYTPGTMYCPIAIFISADSTSETYDQSTTLSAIVTSGFNGSVCVYGYSSLSYSGLAVSSADNVTSRTTSSLSYSAGDIILLCAYSSADNGTLTTTDTDIITLISNNDRSTCYFVGYKIAASSGSSTFTVNSSSSERMGVVAYALTPS